MLDCNVEGWQAQALFILCLSTYFFTWTLTPLAPCVIRQYMHHSPLLRCKSHSPCHRERQVQNSDFFPQSSGAHDCFLLRPCYTFNQLNYPFRIFYFPAYTSLVREWGWGGWVAVDAFLSRFSAEVGMEMSPSSGHRWSDGATGTRFTLNQRQRW